MADIKTRIAMSRQRFGKLRHIWKNNQQLAYQPEDKTLQIMCVQHALLWIGGLAAG